MHLLLFSDVISTIVLLTISLVCYDIGREFKSYYLIKLFFAIYRMFRSSYGSGDQFSRFIMKFTIIFCLDNFWNDCEIRHCAGKVKRHMDPDDIMEDVVVVLFSDRLDIYN